MHIDSFTSVRRRARHLLQLGASIGHPAALALRTNARGALLILVTGCILFAIELFIAFVVVRVMPSAPVEASPTAIERGRMVYVSERCIRCHSHCDRSSTAGALLPGSAGNLDEGRHHWPTRCPGPDLSQVGARRSPLWLKMHLYDPREVSGASIMPSYAFLFRDQRGNDLVAYLASLGGEETEMHAAQEQRWHLPGQVIKAANPSDGERLYNQFCATCHNADGRTRLKWQSEFTESPPLLTRGAMAGSTGSSPGSARIDHVALILKFGIPESDMAGHEHLSDSDIASLSKWLVQRTAQPIRRPQ